eukprot:scaffold92929_cov36-Tisochrysis_lutea.AAC.4
MCLDGRARGATRSVPPVPGGHDELLRWCPTLVNLAHSHSTDQEDIWRGVKRDETSAAAAGVGRDGPRMEQFNDPLREQWVASRVAATVEAAPPVSEVR